MVTHRALRDGQSIKMIWWYIGAIDEDSEPDEGESAYSAKLFDLDEAVATLTFASDREVVRKASEIFLATYGRRSVS